MPKVTVDGVEIEVPQGATVLQACKLERAAQNAARHCERSEAIHGRAIGLLRCARNDERGADFQYDYLACKVAA